MGPLEERVEKKQAETPAMPDEYEPITPDAVGSSSS